MIDIYQKTAKNKCKCEDYTINNDNMLILSDGCSSSPNTHIGSMLYCELGLEYFSTNDVSFHMGVQDWCNFSNYIKTFSKILNKKSTCLDATVLFLRVTDESVFCNICGDGLIFYKMKNKENPEFIKYEYESNTPLYPSYLTDLKRRSVRNEAEKEYSFIEYRYENGSFVKSFVGDSKNSIRHISFNKDEVEYVGIASDGVFDFRKNGELINIGIILKHITEFKGAGEFMKRRMNHMFKCFDKENIYPNDDFSIGVWKNDN